MRAHNTEEEAVMHFGIKTEQPSERSFVIALSGEVDLYTAPQLKQELIRVIETGTENVVVDLSGTTFIDSTTLGVLVSGLKRLRPRGGQLLLVITDRNIAKLFEITGLDRVFPIHGTVADALGEVAVGQGA
jgi:anti-sigma B factor antagonist